MPASAVPTTSPCQHMRAGTAIGDNPSRNGAQTRFAPLHVTLLDAPRNCAGTVITRTADSSAQSALFGQCRGDLSHRVVGDFIAAPTTAAAGHTTVSPVGSDCSITCQSAHWADRRPPTAMISIPAADAIAAWRDRILRQRRRRHRCQHDGKAPQRKPSTIAAWSFPGISAPLPHHGRPSSTSRIMKPAPEPFARAHPCPTGPSPTRWPASVTAALAGDLEIWRARYFRPRPAKFPRRLCSDDH